MANKKKKKRLGAGAVTLSVLFTLILAAGAVYALLAWGGSRPAPADLGEAAAAADKTVALYVPGESTEGQAPEPAAAVLPETARSEEYGYDEILYDQDGLLVAKVKGKRYVGYIAVIDDPMRITLGKCPYFGEAAYGRRVDQMADEAGAILAVNGGGFSDPGGDGRGGMPTGNVIYQGKMLMGYWSPTVGIDSQGKLYAGEYDGNTCLKLGLQWAVSYGPTLIQEGKIVKKLDTYMGEPRTAIGQREDNSIVLLALQGRQLQALGVTCKELAQIMQGYGCINASNLDGGASSDMYFQGKYLNVCNTSGGPRPIPTAILVMPPAQKEG
jgi:exopolysaccharide biosynthesis protein